MFCLKEGLAPVLRCLSVSPSSHILTFLVVFLIILTCWAGPSSSPIGFPPAAFHCILVVVALIVLVYLLKNKVLDAIKTEIQTDGNKTRDEMKILLELQREKDENIQLTRWIKEKDDIIYAQTETDAIKTEIQREKDKNTELMGRIKAKDDIILDLEEKLQMKASLVDALNFQKQTLENQKDQLKEKLQQKANMADGLKEQKQTLENHKDQMKLQLKEVEKKKEENKEKLLSVENKITEAENKKKDKGGLLKEKENLTDVKWKLDEQKTNWEKLILSVEQMLQRIDVLVNSDQVQETTVHSNQGFELLDERRTGVSF
ncbi:uncharacterized protein LOC134006128 isoform X2 [Scomber scombrus]|uniref:uncharacterized protein LOC134006128 isoform X2 n=1 Tax=Scomber scombrus TaxID=13677 RepID=UPI002DDB587E|nr:uncharacterized protein LOC134006128 isoform X2 [Scomber scombrus]